jgi:hypothetical protein
VEVYSTDGEREELLVSTIGDYDGSLPVRAHEESLFGLVPGPHIVVIQADGSWTIRLEEKNNK